MAAASERPQQQAQLVGGVGPEDRMEQQVRRVEGVDHGVRRGRQPAEQVGIPEPELAVMQALVVDPQVQGEEDEVVGDAGVPVLRPEPASGLLDRLAQLALQGRHRVHRLPEEEELPEDGDRDGREEEEGNGAFHGAMIRSRGKKRSPGIAAGASECRVALTSWAPGYCRSGS